MMPPLVALMLALPSAGWAQKPAVLPSIYGADDRKDLYESPPEQRKLAESVAAFLPKDKFSEVGKSGNWFFKADPWEKIGDKPLCPAVRFRGQPNGSDCTATLVAPRLVLTAAHCVENDECAKNNIVFGYGMTTKNRWPTNFPAADLYDCAVVAKGYGTPGNDWALVTLDRAVPDGRAPLKIAENAGHAVDTKIFTIGTPAGLPLKVAGGGTILRSNELFFESDLDALGGNSGGAVFAEDSSEIIGIVTQGGASFAQYRGKDCVDVHAYAAMDARNNYAVLTVATSASVFLPAYRKAVASLAKAGASPPDPAKSAEKIETAKKKMGLIFADDSRLQH